MNNTPCVRIRCGRVITALILLLLNPALAVATDGKSNGKPLELQVSQAGPIFGQRGQTVLTDADLDRFAFSVPAEHRAGTLASPERLGRIIDNLSALFGLANRAVDAGLDQDERVQARLVHSAAQVLGEVYREQHIAKHALDDYGAAALEMYLRDPMRFAPGRAVTFEQILIAPESQDEIEALRKVIAVSDRLDAGTEDFTELARSHSDDPMLSDNSGRYERVRFEQLTPLLQRVLETLSEGQMSAPVRTEFGWHFIRLVQWHEPQKPEFADVEANYREAARTRHLETLNDGLLEEILNQPIELRENAVEDYLDRHAARLPTRQGN